jgi:hypothetical protein
MGPKKFLKIFLYIGVFAIKKKCNTTLGLAPVFIQFDQKAPPDFMYTLHSSHHFNHFLSLFPLSHHLSFTTSQQPSQRPTTIVWLHLATKSPPLNSVPLQTP